MITEIDNNKNSDLCFLLENLAAIFQNNLKIIVGYSEVLSVNCYKYNNDVLLLEEIRKQGFELFSVSFELARLASLISNQYVIKIEELRVKSMVNQLRKKYNKSCKEKGIKLIIQNSCKEADIVFRTDKNALEQILFNLIENSLKFTKKGNVTIHIARQNDGQLEFMVKDTGIGIPFELHKKIFDPFFRIIDSNAHNEADIGLGIGLTKAKLFVNYLDGEISVKSGLVGTIFTVTLPDL